MSGIIVHAVRKIECEVVTQIAFEGPGASVKKVRDAGAGNLAKVVKTQAAAQAKAQRFAQIQARAMQQIAHRG